jgi:hypothetical protein
MSQAKKKLNRDPCPEVKIPDTNRKKRDLNSEYRISDRAYS